MRTGDPDGAARLAAWRQARRRVVRAHHPDVGGDVSTYLAELAAVDAAYGVSSPATTSGPAAVTVATDRASVLVRSVRRRARSTRRRLRTVQSRLPRRVPGSRRYTTL